MIAYIKGELTGFFDGGVVLETSGIGFSIFMSERAISTLPSMGNEVRIHTYLNVREDAMQLFGFLSRDDLDLFRMLIGVSGVGPKGALGILSALSADEFRFAVLAGDVKAITAAPGIGKKTAERLMVELKDKLSAEDFFEKQSGENGDWGDQNSEANDVNKEAVQALVALGYGSAESMQAVKKAGLENATVEEILKEALRQIMF